MSETTLSTAGPTASSRRFQFGVTSLLAAVLVSGLALGWVASKHRQAAEREALVAELDSVGVHPILNEPTGFALLVKKVIPGRESWLRERIGGGWFDRPTVFVCSHLEDQQVSYAVERMARLATVREVHIQGPQLTERGASGLRNGLPGVGVVPSANPALHSYFRSQVDHEHFAFAGAGWMALLVIIGLCGTVAFVVRSFVRRRRMLGPAT